jgi:hypothetical protein
VAWTQCHNFQDEQVERALEKFFFGFCHSPYT